MGEVEALGSAAAFAVATATTSPDAGARPDGVPVRTPAACPICHGTGPFATYVLREMLFGTREPFDYAHCPSCGVLWQPSPPPDLGPYYPPEYHAAGPGLPDRQALGAAARWLHDGPAMQSLFGGHRLHAAVGRRLGPGLEPDVRAVRWLVRQTSLASFDDPILDVGSGPIPERLEQLRRAGFRRLVGIDPWIAADTTYRGITVLRRRIEEVPGSYGLITFHHSFEHLPDPREALRHAASRLRPGGTILIRTPVIGGWFWDHYGTSWWELDPPRHLFVHSRESLDALAVDAGLELVRVAFDSTYLEVIASDQIQRDIPWRSPESYWSDPSVVSADAIEAAKATVRQLNEADTAGRANFFLRKPG